MYTELNALVQRLFQDSQVRNVKFFPGSNSDASPEDFARETNKFFADAEDSPPILDAEEHIDE